MLQGLSPEVDVILCSGRICLEVERVGRIHSLLKNGIDWAYLLQIAQTHRMTPFLYKALQAIPPSTMPTPVLAKLENDFHIHTRRNLILTAKLLHILRLCERQGIQAVPFRGPALAAALYGDLALRLYGDLDILVRKQDVLRTTQLLVSSGFRPFFPLPEKDEAIFRRGEHAFILEPGRILVDLHWADGRRFFSSPYVDHLWDRLEPVTIGGRSVLGFSREDLFIHLCAHGSKHNWQRLDWISDIAQFTSLHRELDWPGLMEKAGSLGIKRMVVLGLSLARDFFGADLPEQVLKEFPLKKGLTALAGQVCKNLVGRSDERLRFVKERLFYLRCMDRLRDRTGYVFERLITPTPWACDLVRLPSFLFFLYYFIRPIQLVGRHGLKPLMRSIGIRHA